MPFQKLKAAVKGAAQGVGELNKRGHEEMRKVATAAAQEAVREAGGGGSNVDTLVERAVAKAMEAKGDQKSSKASGSQKSASFCPVELEQFMVNSAHTWIDDGLRSEYNELMRRQNALIKDFRDFMKKVKEEYPCEFTGS